MNEIFLGKLPTMVQGEEPLGEELIAKLEKYSEDHNLPSYEVIKNNNGDFTAKKIEK